MLLGHCHVVRVREFRNGCTTEGGSQAAELDGVSEVTATRRLHNGGGGLARFFESLSEGRRAGDEALHCT